MASKIKNIIIFLVIGTVFVLIYIFFIKGSSNTATLVSSTSAPQSESGAVVNDTAIGSNSLVAQDFLNLLLSVKSIKLNDSLFSDPAFASLHDSSITLVPDATEGRPNPFAPIGTDIIPVTTNTTSTNNPPATTGANISPGIPAPVKK